MVASTLSFLQLVNIVLGFQAKSPVKHLYASTSAFAVSIIVLYLSFLNHARSIRPFDLLNLFLFASVCVDSTQVTLLHLIATNHCQVSPVSVALIAVKAVLLILELQSKRSILREPWQHLSFEETDSIISQAFYWWVNSLLRKGRYKLLEFEDLPPIPHALSSKILRERMNRCWENQCTRKVITTGKSVKVTNSINQPDQAGDMPLPWQL